MTDLDLDAIGARAKAATPGPWEAQNYDGAEMDGNWPCLDRVGRPDSAKALAHIALGSEDAEFIAHAREDIPALIARIRELEMETTSLRAPRRCIAVGQWLGTANRVSRMQLFRYGWKMTDTTGATYREPDFPLGLATSDTFPKEILHEPTPWPEHRAES